MNPLASYFLRSILISFSHLLVCLPSGSCFHISLPKSCTHLFVFCTIRVAHPVHLVVLDLTPEWYVVTNAALIMQFMQSPVLTSKCTPQHHNTEHHQPLNHISYCLYCMCFLWSPNVQMTGNYFSFDDCLSTNPFRKTQL